MIYSRVGKDVSMLFLLPLGVSPKFLVYITLQVKSTVVYKCKFRQDYLDLSHILSVQSNWDKFFEHKAATKVENMALNKKC